MAALLRRGLHRHSCAGKLNAVKFSLASAVLSSRSLKVHSCLHDNDGHGGDDDERNAFARIAADKKLIFGKGRRGEKKILLLLILFGPSCLGACGETAASLSATSQTLDLSVQGPRRIVLTH